MEDDKIKEIFSEFAPELSSSTRFMHQLQRNMEAVEIVKRHQAAMKKRNRLAVAIAAFAGFVTGVILTLLYPLIVERLTTRASALSQLHINIAAVDFGTMTWIVMAGCCLLAALSAYDVALARLTPKMVAK